jgi:hypothetical protein
MEKIIIVATVESYEKVLEITWVCVYSIFTAETLNISLVPSGTVHLCTSEGEW